MKMSNSKNKSNKFKKKGKLHKSNNSKNNLRNSVQEEIERLNISKKEMVHLNLTEINSFSILPLSKKTQRGLTDNKYIEPTKVQSMTLMHSLRGFDVVAAAKTGSGKTLAFILPLLELLHCNLWSYLDGLGALIITPTRELAYQIFEVLNKVGRYHDFSAGLVIGGKDLKYEWSRISNCNILICTPGRLLQHMTENPEFTCENLKLLILDEADQCLSMGFSETMNIILEELPSDRQTMLFSATQTRDVKDLIRAGCHDPVFCSVDEKSKTVTPKNLQESYMVCQEQDKIAFLWSFLKYHKNNKILVFLATCKQVGFFLELFTHLRPGLSVMGLHGDMNQLRRMAIYDDFRDKKTAVLFATDVAARGLDFPSVHWVIQLDCPEDVTTYIHRVGRTARFSSTGEALLVLSPSQEEAMVANLKEKNIKVEQIEVDSQNLRDIQLKVDFAVSKYFNLKDRAERALKAYLKNISIMKNKKVFDVLQVDLDSLARSFGLSVTPRVRFLEKQLKSKKVHSNSSFSNEGLKNVRKKTFSELGITEDDDEGDENTFLCKSETERLQVNVNSKNDPVLDALSYTRSSFEGLTKYHLANKLIKKNLTLNTKIIFDEEGSALSQEDEVKQADQVDNAHDTAGIDLQKLRDNLQVQDKLDRIMNSQRLREKHRKEKEKLKEEKLLKQKQKSEMKNTRRTSANENEMYAQSDSDESDNSFTKDIIDDLPDPDKIYDNQQIDNENSVSNDNIVDNKRYSKEERITSFVEDNLGSVEDKQKSTGKKKKNFRGKREAKELAKEAKRSRLAADNNLSAISFSEKEDLALFLLKGNS